MGGRYYAPDETAIEREWYIGGRSNPNPFRGSYNAAPTQRLPVIRIDQSGNCQLALLRWGLIPSWAKEASVGVRLINARAETIATKPSFRAAYTARRCLVPAAGLYEWRQLSTGKQPYYFTLADGNLMAFAGLWERWCSPTGDIESFTIVTTEANDTMLPIHSRMPLIVPRAKHDAWLVISATRGHRPSAAVHRIGNARLSGKHSSQPSIEQ